MKITDVNVFVVGNPWKNWVLVKLETDEGLSGWGDATTGLSSQPVVAAVREMRRLCVGLDPCRIGQLWDTVFKALNLPTNGILLSAMAGVTTACWDVLARSLDAPLHRILGGVTHERIKAYANGWYTGPREPGAYAERAAQVVSRGYRALKFDPFGSTYRFLDPNERRRSLELVAAVRQAVGEDVDLLIEAHDRFTVPEAVRIISELEEFSPAWVEAPVWAEDIPALSEVARSTRVRIVAGERFTTPRQFADLLQCGRFDVVQPEYVELGGIARLREVASIAEAYGAVIAPHNARCSLSTAVNVHVMATLRNAHVLECFDDFNVPWARDIFAGLPQVVDGYLVPTEAPGLGIDVNEAAFDAHPYSEHNFMNLFAEGWEQRKALTPSRAKD